MSQKLRERKKEAADCLHSLLNIRMLKSANYCPTWCWKTWAYTGDGAEYGHIGPHGKCKLCGQRDGFGHGVGASVASLPQWAAQTLHRRLAPDDVNFRARPRPPIRNCYNSCNAEILKPYEPKDGWGWCTGQTHRCLWKVAQPYTSQHREGPAFNCEISYWAVRNELMCKNIV